ncbi:MAG: hypothetical protein KKE53_01315 [Proteobacteria bacterium]|nr:hypothetical protein [Pseudomonadota bacterium]
METLPALDCFRHHPIEPLRFVPMMVPPAQKYCHKDGKEVDNKRLYTAFHQWTIL